MRWLLLALLVSCASPRPAPPKPMLAPVCEVVHRDGRVESCEHIRMHRGKWYCLDDYQTRPCLN